MYTISAFVDGCNIAINYCINNYRKLLADLSLLWRCQVNPPRFVFREINTIQVSKSSSNNEKWKILLSNNYLINK